MSVFLSASYFVPTNDGLGAMIFGNLRYGFDVAPMSGFANVFSGNLGDFEAGCGFKLSELVGWAQAKARPLHLAQPVVRRAHQRH